MRDPFRYMKIYLVALWVMAAILTFFIVARDVQAEDKEEPIFEKIETVKETKSSVYYSSVNDHYYIYCKGRWYEMSNEDEWEDGGDGEVTPIETPTEEPTEISTEEPTEEPTEDEGDDEGDYKK